MSLNNDLSKGTPARVTRRFWWIAAGFTLLALVTHPWWLRGLAVYLAAEEPPAPADVVVVFSGDHRLQRAADLLDDGRASEIWLLERDEGYPVSAGILSPSHTIEAEYLSSCGITDRNIRVLSGRIREVEEAGQVIIQAATALPGKRVLVLCHELHCRNLKIVLNRLAPPTTRSHISIQPVAPDAFSTDRWWRSRSGWKETFSALFELGYTWTHGTDREILRVSWDPDEYERQFISAHQADACHHDE